MECVKARHRLSHFGNVPLVVINLYISLMLVSPIVHGGWMQKHGLWFYFSKEHLNYKEASDFCETIGGHLVTIASSDTDYYSLTDTLQFLGTHTERWIGLSTVKTNHTCDHQKLVWAEDYDCVINNFLHLQNKVQPNKCSGVTLVSKYNRTHTNTYLKVRPCSLLLGFTCQWQCRQLTVIPDVDYTMYENIEEDIQGEYTKQSGGVTDGITKYYTRENSNIHTILIYVNNQWDFISNDTRHVTSEPHHYSHVPYDNHLFDVWSGKYTERVPIDFMCSDCEAFELTVKTERGLNYRVVLYKVYSNGTKYGNPFIGATLEHDLSVFSNLWHYKDTFANVYFKNEIFPMYDYIKLGATRNESYIEAMKCVTNELTVTNETYWMQGPDKTSSCPKLDFPATVIWSFVVICFFGNVNDLLDFI